MFSTWILTNQRIVKYYVDQSEMSIVMLTNQRRLFTWHHSPGLQSTCWVWSRWPDLSENSSSSLARSCWHDHDPCHGWPQLHHQSSLDHHRQNHCHCQEYKHGSLGCVCAGCCNWWSPVVAEKVPRIDHRCTGHTDWRGRSLRSQCWSIWTPPQPAPPARYFWWRECVLVNQSEISI